MTGRGAVGHPSKLFLLVISQLHYFQMVLSYLTLTKKNLIPTEDDITILIDDEQKPLEKVKRNKGLRYQDTSITQCNGIDRIRLFDKIPFFFFKVTSCILVGYKVTSYYCTRFHSSINFLNLYHKYVRKKCNRLSQYLATKFLPSISSILHSEQRQTGPGLHDDEHSSIKFRNGLKIIKLCMKEEIEDKNAEFPIL